MTTTMTTIERLNNTIAVKKVPELMAKKMVTVIGQVSEMFNYVPDAFAQLAFDTAPTELLPQGVIESGLFSQAAIDCFNAFGCFLVAIDKQRMMKNLPNVTSAKVLLSRVSAFVGGTSWEHLRNKKAENWSVIESYRDIAFTDHIANDRAVDFVDAAVMNTLLATMLVIGMDGEFWAGIDITWDQPCGWYHRAAKIAYDIMLYGETDWIATEQFRPLVEMLTKLGR